MKPNSISRIPKLTKNDLEAIKKLKDFKFRVKTNHTEVSPLKVILNIESTKNPRRRQTQNLNTIAVPRGPTVMQRGICGQSSRMKLNSVIYNYAEKKEMDEAQDDPSHWYKITEHVSGNYLKQLTRMIPEQDEVVLKARRMRKNSSIATPLSPAPSRHYLQTFHLSLQNSKTVLQRPQLLLRPQMLLSLVNQENNQKLRLLKKRMSMRDISSRDLDKI